MTASRGNILHCLITTVKGKKHGRRLYKDKKPAGLIRPGYHFTVPSPDISLGMLASALRSSSTQKSRGSTGARLPVFSYGLRTGFPVAHGSSPAICLASGHPPRLLRSGCVYNFQPSSDNPRWRDIYRRQLANLPPSDNPHLQPVRPINWQTHKINRGSNWLRDRKFRSSRI